MNTGKLVITFSDELARAVPEVPELPSGRNPQFVTVVGEGSGFFVHSGVMKRLQQVPFERKGDAVGLHYAIIELAHEQGGNDMAATDRAVLEARLGLTQAQQLATLVELTAIGLLQVEAAGTRLLLTLPDLPLTELAE